MKVSTVEGVTQLINKLRARLTKYDSGDVTVGYTAEHALYVHEMDPSRIVNLGMGVPRKSGLGEYWGPTQYGPKFLERPAREMRKELLAQIAEDVRKGLRFSQALLRAGLVLQAASQKLVPVEYGTLKQSAFTRLELK